MASYEQKNFEQIATAIRMEAGEIAKHGNLFEAAALWYRLNRRRPARIAPSRLREKLDQIPKSARRLLKSLGVNDPNEAVDGPGDREILNALVLLGEPNPDPVVEATRRIGRLVDPASCQNRAEPQRLLRRACSAGRYSKAMKVLKRAGVGRPPRYNARRADRRPNRSRHNHSLLITAIREPTAQG
jgi:hypothetical protein